MKRCRVRRSNTDVHSMPKKRHVATNVLEKKNDKFDRNDSAIQINRVYILENKVNKYYKDVSDNSVGSMDGIHSESNVGGGYYEPYFISSLYAERQQLLCALETHAALRYIAARHAGKKEYGLKQHIRLLKHCTEEGTLKRVSISGEEFVHNQKSKKFYEEEEHNIKTIHSNSITQTLNNNTTQHTHPNNTDTKVFSSQNMDSIINTDQKSLVDSSDMQQTYKADIATNNIPDNAKSDLISDMQYPTSWRSPFQAHQSYANNIYPNSNHMNIINNDTYTMLNSTAMNTIPSYGIQPMHFSGAAMSNLVMNYNQQMQQVVNNNDTNSSEYWIPLIQNTNSPLLYQYHTMSPYVAQQNQYYHQNQYYEWPSTVFSHKPNAT